MQRRGIKTVSVAMTWILCREESEDRERREGWRRGKERERRKKGRM